MGASLASAPSSCVAFSRNVVPAGGIALSREVAPAGGVTLWGGLAAGGVVGGDDGVGAAEAAAWTGRSSSRAAVGRIGQFADCVAAPESMAVVDGAAASRDGATSEPGAGCTPRSASDPIGVAGSAPRLDA